MMQHTRSFYFTRRFDRSTKAVTIACHQPTRGHPYFPYSTSVRKRTSLIRISGSVRHTSNPHQNWLLSFCFFFLCSIHTQDTPPGNRFRTVDPDVDSTHMRLQWFAIGLFYHGDGRKHFLATDCSSRLGCQMSLFQSVKVGWKKNGTGWKNA
ncbi:hypothetical protein QBC41DRAFT_140126 [Cercophora samala]|uniref:Uncharacterized protein n=1 Tax=Cercophora samala TaxID=330535 RepID=A0AA39ZAG1_9PEZI|nr:hypothetical protein QBC41DRAFT_140126 [Cercophora samala]